MAYVQPQTRNNRAAILASVAAIHAGIGYLLVTGLGVAWVDTARTILDSRNIPATPPEPMPPPPQPDEMVKPAETPPPFAPKPKLDVNPKSSDVTVTVIPLPYDPTPIPRDTGTPTPLPSATPLFTPKVAAPRGNAGQWVTTDDYPTAALRQGRAGTTRFRVTVSADGRVTGCEIVGSSGSPDLDAATCRNVSKRGRFDPATDNQGAKVGGSWTSSVKWVIPL